MDVQAHSRPTEHMPADSLEKHDSATRNRSVLIRILRNPLFLVIFTWVLMAFLLAFEVSGK